VPSAVNVAIRAGIPEEVRPFLPLVEKLGRVFTSLHAGGASELTVEFVGDIAKSDTQALTLSALRGLLQDVVAEPVTYVNAPGLAEERGLKVSTLHTAAGNDYVSLVRLCAGDVRVAGTVIGPGHRQRLVEVWGFDLDMEPTDHMVFWRYVDRPGVVGLIGGALGAAGVNIAHMQVGREEQGGNAVIAMGVDSAVPEEVVTDISEQIGASQGRRITLG
jgi:D-3-phosphoglycerate dehydrogenase